MSRTTTSCPAPPARRAPEGPSIPARVRALVAAVAPPGGWLDCSPALLAAVLDLDLDTATAMLDELVVDTPARRLEDGVCRLLPADRADAPEDEDLERHLEWWAGQAETAARAVAGRFREGRRAGRPGGPVDVLAAPHAAVEARAWFDRHAELLEHLVVTAYRHGCDEEAAVLAEALTVLLRERGLIARALHAAGIGYRAARRRGLLDSACRHAEVAVLLALRGRDPDALREIRLATTETDQASNPPASGYENPAHDPGLRAGVPARVHAAIGRVWLAYAEVHRLAGRADEALRRCEIAHHEASRGRDRRLVAEIAVGRGRAHHLLGDHDAAEEHLLRAIAILFDDGEHLARAEALIELARVLLDAGRTAQAATPVREAAVLLAEAGSPRQQRIARELLDRLVPARAAVRPDDR